MKKSAKFLLPAAMAFALSACSATPEERFQRAQDAFAAGDFAAAKIDLTAALKEQAGNAQGLRLLAQTQLELGDGEGATNSLARLKSLGDWSEGDTILLAEAALLRGRFDEVTKIVDGIGSAEAARVSALAHIAMEDFGAAEQTFRDGVMARGPKARLRAEYARFFLAIGEIGSARSMIETAKSEDATEPDVQIADGQISAAQGQPQDAFSAFENVLRARPANRVALLGRVAALGEMGKLDEAEAALSDINVQKDDIDYAYLAAKLASERKDWGEVRSILQPLEARLSQKPEVEVLYGLALAKVGQPQQARSRLAPLVRKFPRSRTLRVSLAEVELAAEDPRAAFKTMKTVADRADASREELELMSRIAKASGDPLASLYSARAKAPQGERFASLLTKGDQALRKENWSEAVTAYQAIITLAGGDNAMVLNNLAYALGKTGRADEGLAHAQKALKLESNNASIMDTVGMLLLQTGGDRDEAVAILRRANKLAPGNRNIAERLKQAERT